MKNFSSEKIKTFGLLKSPFSNSQELKNSRFFSL